MLSSDITWIVYEILLVLGEGNWDYKVGNNTSCHSYCS